MNTKTKKRLILVSGVIIIVLIVVLAFVGGNTAAKTISVGEAVDGVYEDQKVQVSGNVVDNSFETTGNTLTFDIYDPEGDASKQLHVSFEGGVSATFGNDVVAICTGKIENGVLHASELVTKCPSKYESASNALTVERLLEYGSEVYDKPVKIIGEVKADTLKPAGQGDRFVLLGEEGTEEIPVEFDGALSEEIQEGTTVIVSGSLGSNLKFIATSVALEG